MDRFEVEEKKIARDGGRTHAHIRELDLKSNALTTRPPWRTWYWQILWSWFLKLEYFNKNWNPNNVKIFSLILKFFP